MNVRTSGPLRSVTLTILLGSFTKIELETVLSTSEEVRTPVMSLLPDAHNQSFLLQSDYVVDEECQWSAWDILRATVLTRKE